MRTVRNVLEGHPQIQDAYMDEQEHVGQPRNLDVEWSAAGYGGGFSWTSAKDNFWSSVLEYGNFDKFYAKYPRTDLGSSTDLDAILKTLEVKKLAINQSDSKTLAGNRLL